MHKDRRPTHRRSAGFTLMELIVVIVILGILMTTVSVGYFKWVDSANQRRVDVDATAVVNALRLYLLERNLRKPERKHLEALVQERYLKELPKDAWNNNYDIEIRGDALYFTSPGPDGSPGNDDDIKPDKTIDLSFR